MEGRGHEGQLPAVDAAGTELYRALFEQSPLMCFVVDPAGTVVRVNAQGAKELGCEREELLGQSVLGVFLPEDHAVVLRHIKGCLDNPTTAQSWELRKKRRDGSQLWVREFARAMRNPDGSPVVLISCENVTERKRAENDLRQTADQLRALAAHLQSVREEERTRIARELHDELGQMLISLKIKLRCVADRLPATSMDGAQALPARQQIHALCAHLDDSLNAIRRLVAELRPAILDQLGLDDALESLARDYAESAGIRCEFVASFPSLHMTANQTTALYRIVQESLTNVVRHSGAKRAGVRLDRDGDELRLVVEDDGKGIEPDCITSPTSYGIQGMREHAIQLGGTLRIEGQPGRGTTLTVRIPQPIGRD